MDVGWQKSVCTGTALKRLACASMLLDHIGASCLEAGVFSAVPAAARPGLLAADIALRMAGRLAFPIYCFLLAEGFVHTHSAKAYALRLLAFALLSEVPFDLAFYGVPLSLQHQNVYWTLALGIAAMALMRRFDAGGVLTLRGALSLAACAAAAQLLRADYGAAGVLLIAALYALRADRKRQCAAGAALAFCMQPALTYSLCAAAAFVPVWFYSGARGRCGRAQRWAYYVFYPAHLAVLAAVTDLLIL